MAAGAAQWQRVRLNRRTSMDSGARCAQATTDVYDAQLKKDWTFYKRMGNLWNNKEMVPSTRLAAPEQPTRRCRPTRVPPSPIIAFSTFLRCGNLVEPSTLACLCQCPAALPAELGRDMRLDESTAIAKHSSPTRRGFNVRLARLSVPLARLSLPLARLSVLLAPLSVPLARYRHRHTRRSSSSRFAWHALPFESA